MAKEAEKMPCAKCGREMELLMAKGKKGRRLWGCQNCSGDPEEPLLYIQPVASLRAVRKLEPGSLIDLSVKQQNLLE